MLQSSTEPAPALTLGVGSKTTISCLPGPIVVDLSDRLINLMVMQMDLTFSALADPTRRAILARLAVGDATVAELAKPFAISAPAISRHLNVLEAARLIERHRSGKHRRCTLRGEALAEAHEWINQYRRFWIGAFDRLDEHLKKEP